MTKKLAAKRKPARSHVQLWTVYRGMAHGWRHQVVEVCGRIMLVREVFDHLGAAQAYERSLRAFLKEQATVRALGML